MRRLDLRRELGISPPLCSISETRGRQPTELITPSAPQPQNRRMKSSTSPETRSLETSSISSRTITRMVRHPARDLVERKHSLFLSNLSRETVCLWTTFLTSQFPDPQSSNPASSSWMPRSWPPPRTWAWRWPRRWAVWERSRRRSSWPACASSLSWASTRMPRRSATRSVQLDLIRIIRGEALPRRAHHGVHVSPSRDRTSRDLGASP